MAFGQGAGNGSGMLRMDKILVGAEEAVVVAASRWVGRRLGDCVEGRDDKILEGFLKGIREEPCVVI